MAGIVGNNELGFFHTITKVRRAISRKGRDYLKKLVNDARDSTIKGKDGGMFPVLVGRPDMKRLKLCFLHIAYGLYFHKFGKRFIGECSIILDFVTYEEDVAENYKLLCRKRFEMEVGRPYEGVNSEVFRFQFFDPDEFGLIALRMIFYGGSSVFVAFKGEEAKEPFNLLTELMRSGKKVTVTIEDGSMFTIN